MKILLTTSANPTNLQSGIGLIIANLLHEISKDDNVSVDVVVLGEYDENRLRIELSELTNNRSILKSVVSRDAKAVSVYRSLLRLRLQASENEFLNIVHTESGKYDVLVWVGSAWDPVSMRIPSASVCPAVHYLIDSITLFEKNRPKGSMNNLRALIASIQEKRIVNQGYVKTIYVSEADAKEGRLLSGSEDNNAICVIPNGVDISKFSRNIQKHKNKKSIPIILFTGVMEYLPNVDAAIVLVKEVLPRLKNHVMVRIVGRNPTEAVKALACAGRVVVTGAVVDIVKEYQDADIFVVPMLSGTGFKNKIIEAMSCGLPVVSTTHALKGFASLPPGTVAVDGWGNMAEVVDSLSSNSEKSVSMGMSASEYVVRHCSWGERAKEFIEVMRGVC